MWNYEERVDPKTKEIKKTKVPYQINRSGASPTDPQTWSTFQECADSLRQFDGLGFVFANGYTGIDLDHCFLPGGALMPFAREILELFPSYTETSPSGEGLHIIIQSDQNLPGRRVGPVECYSSKRFFTVTGDVFEGRDTITDCDIAAWYRETFPAELDKTNYPAGTGYLPDDATILRVMQRSRSGDKITQLWSGQWQTLNYPSQSEAELALASYLMFFCANDLATADRLFRQSGLLREKWDERRGVITYGQKTLIKATSPEIMDWKPPTPSGSSEDEYIMSKGKNPVPLVILENLCRVFERDQELRSRFRLNDFSHTVETCDGTKWEPMLDTDVLEAQRYVSVHYEAFAKVSREVLIDTICLVAARNKVNPVRDYFTGLVWDGVSRLDSWLHVAYGVPNDELHTAIGSNWLKGLVKRVIEPGCQFDEVLVLEGKQGWRKSSSLRALGSPWHVESTLSTDDKDFYMLLARNIIVEFAEGEIVGRTSARKLKAIITKVEDIYRAPYARAMSTHKRGCVFAMTTNDSDYQKDETGGRRWLPVVLGKVADVDWITANRDQLFAEAYHRVITLKETTYEYPETLGELQATKTEFDEIADAIITWYEKLPSIIKEDGVLTIDAYNGALYHKSQWSTADGVKEIPNNMTWRIGRVFRATLGLTPKAVRRDGKLVKRWVKE